MINQGIRYDKKDLSRFGGGDISFQLSDEDIDVISSWLVRLIVDKKIYQNRKVEECKNA